MKQLKYILALLAATALSTACTDNLAMDEGGAPSEDGKGIGEMILFAAGTTSNSVSTRADGEGGAGGDGNGGDNNQGNSYTETPGKTYYMPNDYRFVCRMYYQAAAASDNTKYDVSGETDVTSWLKVKGDVGNSLYWRNTYPVLDENDPDLFDSYGNDAEATYFYWQNRKEHAFLAWTDLNKAKSIGYDPTPNSGTLKFMPEDVIYTIHTGDKIKQWVDDGYEVLLNNGETKEFRTMADLRAYLETDDNYLKVQGATIPDADFTDQHYYYEFGWSCKKRIQKDATYDQVVGSSNRKYGWYEYQMFYDKLNYEGSTSGTGIEIRNNAKGEPGYLFSTTDKKYLAEIEIKFYKTDDSGLLLIPKETYTLAEGDVKEGTTTAVDKRSLQDRDKIKHGDKYVAQCIFEYHLTDEYGNVKYDETKARFLFYYKLLQEEKEDVEVTKNLPANAFDLTSTGKTSIDQQPDIVQALTKQAPLGATQSANRVNLYFKHQFSMVQVNVKSSADLSVVINKNHIKKVELLGVANKAYVFTELNEDGDVEPTTFEPVKVSDYSDTYLAQNPYGTSFQMFDMGEANYATGYIKSFNALTFGELHAIRITWTEQVNSGIEHISTYTVADQKLQNLKSGRKYIWNIELRRGTLAIVRTEIVDWIVPASGLEYNTNGTIYN